MASIAEQLEEKGFKRGRGEGERAIVLRQLERRFGSLPPEALTRIKEASSAEIERWADRILTAATLAEVLE
ncbi:MAG: DUF4351 domain-containing protein [Polyangiaceae bacterium]